MSDVLSVLKHHLYEAVTSSDNGGQYDNGTDVDIDIGFDDRVTHTIGGGGRQRDVDGEIRALAAKASGLIRTKDWEEALQVLRAVQVRHARREPSLLSQQFGRTFGFVIEVVAEASRSIGG